MCSHLLSPQTLSHCRPPAAGATPWLKANFTPDAPAAPPPPGNGSRAKRLGTLRRSTTRSTKRAISPYSEPARSRSWRSAEMKKCTACAFSST